MNMELRGENSVLCLGKKITQYDQSIHNMYILHCDKHLYSWIVSMRRTINKVSATSSYRGLLLKIYIYI